MGKFVIFILAVIAAAAGGTAYHLKVDALRIELAETEQRRDEFKSEAGRKAVPIIPKKQENTDLQAKVDQMTKVASENERLAAEIPVLETALADVTREFVDAVA